MNNEFSTTRRRLLQLGLTVASGAALASLPGVAWGQGTPVTRLKVGLTPPASQVTVGFLAENAGTGPLQPMYEMLMMRDRETLEIVPMLAKSWAMSPDGKTWTLQLRDDVTFHHGGKFTAKDVVFSWEITVAPESRVSTAGVFRKITSIDVKSDYEPVLNLDVAEPEMPYFLTQAFLIYSKDHWDNVGEERFIKEPVGTGPFRFVEFREGEYILYSRIENHWRQTPEFEELQLLYMPEATTRLAALLTGEIHIAEIPRAVQNQALARGKQIVASTGSPAIIAARFGGNFISEIGKPDASPLTNKLVREAMNIAVNREEINQQLFNGRGKIAIVDAFQDTDPEWNPEWQPYAFDPERAKALLVEAGYPNGFDFEMTVVSPPGFPEIPSVVEAMSIYFTAIGLRPTLVQLEVSDQNALQRSRGLKNKLFSNRQATKPLFQAMDYFYSKGVYGFFEDPYIEERLERFYVSVDPAERSQIIKEVGQFLHDQHGSIPLIYVSAEVAVDPAVVAEYKADIGAYGASVGHEYTKRA